ncbi:hypothetical protein [Piscirickettsia litoralis]|uniref:Uncharacterized protein n=1 Tax=Piscirickettsia litoralis TaxID=1891921 RepID=A0ABX3A6Q5_9GAMM|nr:hypothetical protein [Piscirickettsia litoralis]ODN43371.1 hypothetical protein BGC07_11105 [Piscirickettsia litoralis]
MKVSVIGLPDDKKLFFKSLEDPSIPKTMSTLGKNFHHLDDTQFVDYSSNDRFYDMNKKDLRHADLVILVSDPNVIEESPQKIYLDLAQRFDKEIINGTSPTGELICTPQEVSRLMPTPHFPEHLPSSKPAIPLAAATSVHTTGEPADPWAVSTPFNERRHRRGEQIAQKMQEDAFDNESGL